MPRIIVTTQPSRLPDDAEVLLDEDVHSVHLSTRHAASQLVERLSWAIRDAEDAELVRHETRRGAARQPLDKRSSMRVAVGA